MSIWKYFLSHLVWLLQVIDWRQLMSPPRLFSSIWCQQYWTARPSQPNPDDAYKSLNTLEMWFRSRTKFRDLNPWFMMLKVREHCGQVRWDVWSYNRERPDQSSSHQTQSETDLGRKSQEQFVTVASPVASPALPMQNWHQAGSSVALAGCVGTLGTANEPPGHHIYH